MTFRVYFNRKRQYVDVHVIDVHPTTFANWGGGRWGYYQAEPNRGRTGKFGELRFVKGRVEQAADHEIMHWWIDLIVHHRGTIITSKNEEKVVNIKDDLTTRFWREYKRPR